MPLKGALLLLQVWQAPCSAPDLDALPRAVSGAAAILRPCGIRLEAEAPRRLESRGLCDLPRDEEARRPILAAETRPLRLKNPRGLSLFLLPTSLLARYSFAVIELGPDAGCGSPREPGKLPDSGSLFITDFGLLGGDAQSALLLAHEIAHALTMKPHPTRAAKGSLLADRLADMGGRVLPEDCACMRQSPFLRPAK